uniref:Uncharacterized protein n=1 Tax=Glossina palpalis gambiensis TaxID=67801 RepID=A0A1B0C001_9MUSC
MRYDKAKRKKLSTLLNDTFIAQEIDSVMFDFGQRFAWFPAGISMYITDEEEFERCYKILFPTRSPRLTLAEIANNLKHMSTSGLKSIIIRFRSCFSLALAFLIILQKRSDTSDFHTIRYILSCNLNVTNFGIRDEFNKKPTAVLSSEYHTIAAYQSKPSQKSGMDEDFRRLLDRDFLTCQESVYCFSENYHGVFGSDDNYDNANILNFSSVTDIGNDARGGTFRIFRDPIQRIRDFVDNHQNVILCVNTFVANSYDPKSLRKSPRKTRFLRLRPFKINFNRYTNPESYISFIEAKKQFYNTVKEAKFIQRIKTINDNCKSGNSKTFSKFIKAHHRVPHKGILWNSDNNIAYLNLLKNSITANNAAIATHIPSSHYRSKCISDMSSKNRQMRQRLMLLMRKRRRTNLNSIMVRSIILCRFFFCYRAMIISLHKRDILLEFYACTAFRTTPNDAAMVIGSIIPIELRAKKAAQGL